MYMTLLEKAGVIRVCKRSVENMKKADRKGLNMIF